MSIKTSAVIVVCDRCPDSATAERVPHELDLPRDWMAVCLQPAGTLLHFCPQCAASWRAWMGFLKQRTTRR